jgi:hypothetical protein
MSNEIETVTESFPSEKSLGPDRFTGEFYQSIEELTPVLLKLFHKA